MIDTAGLRETEDPVEREGVERARRAAEAADLRIHLVDAAEHLSPAPLFADELLVMNKVDLVAARDALPTGIQISCRSGEGIELLVQAILAKATGRSSALGEAAPDVTAINTRHRDCLLKARGHLEAAISLLESGEPPELVAVELRSALGDVGEIVGEAGTEEILGKIFSSFCIGK